MAAELGSRVFKLERLGHKLATPEGTPSISLPKYLPVTSGRFLLKTLS